MEDIDNLLSAELKDGEIEKEEEGGIGGEDEYVESDQRPHEKKGTQNILKETHPENTHSPVPVEAGADFLGQPIDQVYHPRVLVFAVPVRMAAQVGENGLDAQGIKPLFQMVVVT
jgi:hypothetical protein